MQPFSLHTIEELAKTIAGTKSASGEDQSIGKYRSGAEIERFITGCGFAFQLNGLSRYPALYNFLCNLNNGTNASINLTCIIEAAGDPRQFDAAKASTVLSHLNRFLIADGYELVLEEGKARLNNKKILKGLFMREFFDFDTVDREVNRIIKNLSVDPEDCITAACSLVESMCRSILVEMEVELPKERTLKTLFKAIQQPLGIAHTKNDKFSDEMNEQIRTILTALSTLSQGIGSLRTCMGDAHGREVGFPQIDIRIARLAVNSANTLSIFLIETWEKKMNKKLPDKSE